MSKKPESRLQTKIREALTQGFPNIFVTKVHGGPFQAAGLPDLVGCLDGKFFGFEVKRPGREGTLTALQAETLNRLQDAGALAEIVTSGEEAVALLKGLSGDAYHPTPYLRNPQGKYTRGGL